MDFERNQRRQSIRIIISEAIMVLSVIIMVTLLAFAASGYWLSSDFEVKRQGMLQISSVPTGANVEIDGSSSWLQKTNTSKVLDSGEHTIVLTKDGYDTWSKDIMISEGLFYRIHYPRLFLKERFLEKLFSVDKSALATISSNHETLLLIKDAAEWEYFNLNNENLVAKKIEVTDIFSDYTTSEIVSIDWDVDGRRILFNIESDAKNEWVLLNLDNVKNSINLTKEFGVNFSSVKIFDRSANNLLAVQDGNLRKIDVSGRSMSAVLVEDVIDFDYYDNDVFFSAPSDRNNDTEDEYYIGRLRIGDGNNIEELKTFSSPSKIVVTRFYEDRLMLIVDNNIAKLYELNGFSELGAYELNFIPQNVKVGHEGEFIIMYDGKSSIATLDMETKAINEWLLDGESFGWLDNDMIYSVSGGSLIVYDYDGLNRRKIANNVSSYFPVGITNNRYLYYFSDGYLVREWLIPR